MAVDLGSQLQALRMDPDSAACQKGIKRLRSLNSAKEAGNEAFKQGRWQEAHGHYTAALDIDPDLRSSFAAQCFCNRRVCPSQTQHIATTSTLSPSAVGCTLSPCIVIPWPVVS